MGQHYAPKTIFEESGVKKKESGVRRKEKLGVRRKEKLGERRSQE
ncbi:hypothetical protein VB638_10000 [Dolichospermum sp. UHCC 0684]|jgi:hypothetical protein|nr:MULTISPECIES: hypothetical protein [unclassified Dolichospermum]MEA5529918.1 hypothetical protein [Dolichospermum sp. UHCC 0684]